MDANMQQIMLEAQKTYQSRMVTPMDSRLGPLNGSPHLDSMVYYENPNTPRRRKKIFEPRYKDLQHNRHMNRLQSEVMMRTASVEAQTRISQLNQNFMGGLPTVNQQASVVMGALAANSAAVQQHIAETVSQGEASRQPANLFATALQHQELMTNPLQGHPVENQIAQAFISGVINQPPVPPAPPIPPNSLINVVGSLIGSDIGRQTSAFTANPIANSVQQPPPPAIPYQGNFPSAPASTTNQEMANQNLLDIEAAAIQADLANFTAMQNM